MPTARDRMRQAAPLARMMGLMIALSTRRAVEVALAAEEPFESLMVQCPIQPRPGPARALPTTERRTVNIKDFRGKVVLLGFFAATATSRCT
jgi:hypothetical protein